jgi:F0F1-type ATP synthase alpha subunit
MADVRPEEISAILKQQLSGFGADTNLEEVGTVLQVGDGIARVYGLNRAQSGELVEFENGTAPSYSTSKKTTLVSCSWVRPTASAKAASSSAPARSPPSKWAKAS